MVTQKGDAKQAAQSVRMLLKRFFDSQEAVRELLAFAIQQGQSLDSDDAAARRLAKSALPSDVDAKTVQKVYQAAKQYLNGRGTAAAEASSLEKAALEEGKDPDVARKVRLDAFEGWFEPSYREFTETLEGLGLDAHGIWQVQKHTGHITRRPRLPVFMDSLLMTTVNDFENFVAGIANASYTFQPQVLRESGKEYSWAEVSSYGSIEEFTDFAIDEQVDRLMRDGLDAWMKFMAKATRVPEAKLDACTDRIAEVVQRRHVITHNGGRASRAYLERTKGMQGAGTKLGQRLTVSEEYLTNALDGFGILALTIGTASMDAINLASKQSVGSYFGDELILDLLKLERYACVAPLQELLAGYMRIAVDAEVLKVNSWIARSRLDGAQSIWPEVEAWDVSNLSSEFKLARLVLLEQFELAMSMAADLQAKGGLSTHSMETWPLFAPLRDWRTAGATATARKKATASKGASPAAKKTAGRKKALPAKKAPVAAASETAEGKKATPARKASRAAKKKAPATG